MLLAALLIILFDRLGFGLWGVIGPLWFYILATGFTFPCIQGLALSRHGAQAGTAASLLGASTFGFAGAISPIVGLLGQGTAVPMGAMMASCMTLAIIVLWTVVRPKTVPRLL
jgi:DHA1 family bicyclomycin/chloramphenicol resistance-like MFS transporter